ncbi:MAG: amino acid permease [Pirellulales bacterium]
MRTPILRSGLFHAGPTEGIDHMEERLIEPTARDPLLEKIDGACTLPRVLGPFDALTVVVGSIIGSGIFLKPAEVAKYLGAYGFGAIIAVWIGVGLITLCGSLALAELAAMLPHAGGPYVYLREAYSRMAAFLWGWTEFWIVRTGSLGALAVGTVIYLDKALVAIRPSLALDHYSQEGLALAIVIGLSAINVIATRWGANVQNVTVLIKVGFLVGIILLPFVTGRFDTALLTQTGPERMDWWRAAGLAAIAVLWPYDGWINIGPVAEEIHNPQRNVPLALMLGVGVVITVYVGANLAYHVVLSADQIAASQGVAADVCKKLLGPTGAIVMSIGVMCSMFGAVNSNMLTGPRIYFAMARDGLLPRAIRQVHPRFQTPANAIIAQCVWTVILLLVVYDIGPILHHTGVAEWLKRQQIEVPAAASPEAAYSAFNNLTDFVIFGGSIFYAMAVGAVFVLRRTRPDLPRPYRTWGYPVVPALYLAFFVAVMASMLVDNPKTSIAGICLILTGAFYYAWARRR